MSQTFAHDSLLGGLNIVKRRDGRNLLHPGERPPYPIINDNPSVYEVFSNLNRADLGLLLMFTAIGFPAARFVIRAPVASEYQRRSVFNLVWSFSIAFGGYFALSNSYYRMIGVVENGLRWRRPERKLNKYDFTKEFEKNTIWKHFRLRD